MRSIAFHIQTRGTGKTSCAGNVAAGLARRGHKTALIDCDQQGNASSWFLTAPIDRELADILSGEAETAQTLVEAAPGLFLIPVAPLDGSLTAFAETQLIKKPRAFEFLAADLAGLGFEYAVFDCSPSFSQLERAVIGSADEVITPLTPEYFSMDGIEIFTKELARISRAMRRDIRHDKIVCTMINRSFSHHLAFYENLRKLDYRIFTVPQDTRIPKAQIFHQSLYDFDPKAKAVPSFEELIQAITEA
ncbi:MAG: ParA family protein [Treponema sp.]|jgi:cellulose biosynthesis protein BcsQ|nr:ParA family protein [Treponema sp.]